MDKKFWAVSILAISVTLSSLTANAAPTICNSAQTTTFSKEECVKSAEKSMRASGFSENVNIYEKAGVVFGIKKDYSAVIRCVPDSKVVFFVVAGPACTPETGDGDRSTLEKNFGQK